MCHITNHAIERARERWHLEKSTKVHDAIKDAFDKAELVGEYMGDDRRPRQLLLDRTRRRALVVNPDEDDTVITVFESKLPPLALDMYGEVIQLHHKRVNSFTRRIRALQKQFDAQRDTLVAERNRLDAEIRRLKLMRDHIDGVLDNYQHDLDKLNMDKKTTVHSLGHYLAGMANAMASDCDA